MKIIIWDGYLYTSANKSLINTKIYTTDVMFRYGFTHLYST